MYGAEEYLSVHHQNFFTGPGCCLEYPQICFISAHLSGSHWALRWPWLAQSCSIWVPREGTVSLSVRTLPLPLLLLPSTSSSPPALKQCLTCQGAPPTPDLDLLYASSPGCSWVLERRVINLFPFTGIFNPIFTGFYRISFSLYLSFPI